MSPRDPLDVVRPHPLMDAPCGQKEKRDTEVQLPEMDTLHIQVKFLEVKGDLEHTKLNVQELHTQVVQQFDILGRGVVEARKEDLRRIQELEEQMQRLVDEMATKEVIIQSLAQQVQELSDQGVEMFIPELGQVQENVRTLAKMGEEWDHFLLDQFKGLVSIQREMQAHLQRLSAQVGLDARVGGDCQVASPSPQP